MTPEEIKAAAENKIFEIMDKDPGLYEYPGYHSENQIEKMMIEYGQWAIEEYKNSDELRMFIAETVMDTIVKMGLAKYLKS